MKKLVFLSGEDLMDVDMPIIREMNATYHRQFDITWIIILRGYGWFNHDEISSFCLKNNIKHILLEQTYKLKNPLNISFYIKILKTIKTINAQVIYDSYGGAPYMHFLTIFFLKKSLFVIAIHDVVQHSKMNNRFIRTLYDKFKISRYTNFHIFSPKQLEIFNEKNKNKNSLLTPLYLKEFGEFDHKNKKTKIITNFLFFGIIRPNKGLDVLIKAANILSKKYKNFHITIAGKCDDWEPYYKLIENHEYFTLKIKNIEKSEIPELFAQSHFSILPYRDVTQSGVLLTSYNYNIPVIASKIDWFEQYIQNNTNGFLFKNGSLQNLIDKMEIAINLDLNEYENLTENLKAFVDAEISVKNITKKYVDFFQELG